MTLWRRIPPYDFRYRFTVTPEFAGLTAGEFFRRRFAFRPETYWSDLITRGETTLDGAQLTPETVLREGDVLHTWRRDVTEPPVNAAIRVLHDEAGLFVVDKPAPLPTHPSGRYFKNTLTTILRETRPGRRFHTLHRLDTWTTGVILLATDPEVARHVHRAIEARRVRKYYGVIAVGDFGTEPFDVTESIGRLPGTRRVFGTGAPGAKESLTRFTPLMKIPFSGIPCPAFSPFLAFLKAEPVTGRTNQIRVHVRAAGGHVLNDPIYSPGDPPSEGRISFMGLHCREIDLELPGGGGCRFSAPWPDGFRGLFPGLEEAWERSRESPTGSAVIRAHRSVGAPLAPTSP